MVKKYVEMSWILTIIEEHEHTLLLCSANTKFGNSILFSFVRSLGRVLKYQYILLKAINLLKLILIIDIFKYSYGAMFLCSAFRTLRTEGRTREPSNTNFDSWK